MLFFLSFSFVLLVCLGRPVCFVRPLVHLRLSSEKVKTDRLGVVGRQSPFTATDRAQRLPFSPSISYTYRPLLQTRVFVKKCWSKGHWAPAFAADNRNLFSHLHSIYLLLASMDLPSCLVSLDSYCDDTSSFLALRPARETN
jgi:hypothetical protein